MHSPAPGKPRHNLPDGTKLQGVPSLTAHDADLTIKATATGITFLATQNDQGKFETTMRYRKRYVGSKQYAVDINGGLWDDTKALEENINSYNKEPPKKRKHQVAPQCLQDKLFVNENAQISDNPADPAINCAKKTRKISYKINKQQVRHRLLCYINTQKGKKELYFWTVSFPQGTPDAICFQALNTWLTQLRQYGMLKDYMRVTERQENGTIHFHIAIPHKMPVQRANAMMRGTLKTFAKRGDIPYNERSPQIAKYNGVDISKHRKTKRVTNFAIKKGSIALVTYITKYVTKNDAEFEHLAWHNSRGFSGLFTGITFTVKEFTEFGFGPFLNKIRVFKMNFATFIPWLYGPPPRFWDHLYKLNSYTQSLSANE